MLVWAWCGCLRAEVTLRGRTAQQQSGAATPSERPPAHSSLRAPKPLVILDAWMLRKSSQPQHQSVAVMPTYYTLLCFMVSLLMVVLLCPFIFTAKAQDEFSPFFRTEIPFIIIRAHPLLGL